jgi:hypothetical protein
MRKVVSIELIDMDVVLSTESGDVEFPFGDPDGEDWERGFSLDGATAENFASRILNMRVDVGTDTYSIRRNRMVHKCQALEIQVEDGDGVTIRMSYKDGGLYEYFYKGAYLIYRGDITDEVK